MLILNLLYNQSLTAPDKIFVFVAYALALVIAITIHEFFHAWTANRLGDPTARLEGRISLNPLAHLDLMGTLFLLLAGFGWGKPVPINEKNFRNPKLDELKVALAGPISNFFVAAIFALPLRFFYTDLPDKTIFLLGTIVLINLVLMIFNLLPIPPLDGSHIIKVIIGEDSYSVFAQFGIYILVAIIFLTPLLSIIYDRILNPILFWLTAGHIPTLF